MPRALILGPSAAQWCRRARSRPGSRRHEAVDQQRQQPASSGPGRPRRPVEDTMEVAEVRIAISPQDAQCSRDGTPTRCQDGAGEQQWDVRPRRTGEQVHEPTSRPASAAGADRKNGEQMGVLHPIRRIAVLNRGNLVAVRQIESAVSSRLPDPLAIRHINQVSKPDPTLLQIAAQFTQHGVEKSGGGYLILDRRTSNPVARLRPYQIPIASSYSTGLTSRVAGQPSAIWGA